MGQRTGMYRFAARGSDQSGYGTFRVSANATFIFIVFIIKRCSCIAYPICWNKGWLRLRSKQKVTFERSGMGEVTKFYESFFDRCVVINLPYRKDRLQQFHQNVCSVGWPFKAIDIVPAIHGDTVGVPANWTTGGGSYGCMRSHCRILEDAMMNKLETILVMEDDAVFRSSFVDEVTQFLQRVPTDWDCLMIGGQHINSTPKPVSEGVVRCVNTQRTHCYAVRGKLIKELYRHWMTVTHHCDWAMGPFCAKWNTYAPDPFIVGQSEGRSDINGRNNPAKFWTPPKKDAPVIWFRDASREVIDQLRTCRGEVGNGFHFGYSQNSQGQDVGLDDVFKRDERNPRERERLLRQWIDMIQWEVASLVEPAVCSIWHEQADEELIRKVCGDVLIEAVNPSVEEALKAWKDRGSK